MFDHLLKELYPTSMPPGYHTWRLTRLLDAAFRHRHDEWHGTCLWQWHPQLVFLPALSGDAHD